MKNKILIRVMFLFLAVLLFSTCGKTYIEEAQDAYDASMVIPSVLGIKGTTLALQTFEYDFSPTYHRAGSTWAWSVVGATLQSVSADTRTATVLFNDIGIAMVKVTETTEGGKTSPEDTLEVQVDQFCPLEVSGFVGDWSGTDGMTHAAYVWPSQVVISDATETTVKITGLNFGWMENSWGETITSGGTITMTIANNGTATIADQYCFTTDYDGDLYEYWIEGSATWGNCEASPTLNITYVVYYKSDGYSLPVDWAGAAYPAFYATLTLDGTKGTKAMKAIPPVSENDFPPKRK